MFHWVVVAYSFNSCIWDVEASEFEASLVYRASSRAVKNYNREILSKKKKLFPLVTLILSGCSTTCATKTN